MPFTFSHPALVLPLTFLPRKWVSLTGLVIGSLTPDFEYFIRMRIQSDYSHTISGLFWFDLPLGIFISFVFHNIVRNSLFNNLPLVLSSRLLTFTKFNWNSYFKTSWFVVSVSVLIGSTSHLLWDSFTHSHGYFVSAIPELTNSLEFFGKTVPKYKILQHSSTLIGGLLIAISIFKFPIDKKIKTEFKLAYWGILVIITLSIIGIRLNSGLDYQLYGHVIATGISAGLISLTLTPVILVVTTPKTA